MSITPGSGLKMREVGWARPLPDGGTAIVLRIPVDPHSNAVLSQVPPREA